MSIKFINEEREGEEVEMIIYIFRVFYYGVFLMLGYDIYISVT